MTITNPTISFYRKNGFVNSANDGITHVKILPYLTIVQSTQGSYDISLGKEAAQRTGPGGFFVAPADVQQTIVHRVDEQTGLMSARWLCIDVFINQSRRLDSMYRFPTVINQGRHTVLNELFDRLFAADDVWQEHSICYQILGELTRLSTPIKDSANREILQAISYMKTHLTKELSIDELAEAACMSKSNFYSVFKRQLGVSPLAYLNHYRLSLAADRLLGSRATIGEICSQVGISDPSYFSRIFKRTYGLSPKDYREASQSSQ